LTWSTAAGKTAPRLASLVHLKTSFRCDARLVAAARRMLHTRLSNARDGYDIERSTAVSRTMVILKTFRSTAADDPSGYLGTAVAAPSQSEETSLICIKIALQARAYSHRL
jgi:hypothetical protein